MRRLGILAALALAGCGTLAPNHGSTDYRLAPRAGCSSTAWGVLSDRLHAAPDPAEWMRIAEAADYATQGACCRVNGEFVRCPAALGLNYEAIDAYNAAQRKAVLDAAEKAALEKQGQSQAPAAK